MRRLLLLSLAAALPVGAQVRQTYYSHLGERGSKIYYEQRLSAERQRERANQQQALEDARSRHGLSGASAASDPTAPLGLLAGTLSSLAQRFQARAPEPQLTVEQKLAKVRAKAEQGDLEAQTALAWVYANGYRDKNGFQVPKDETQARHWVRRAAEGGDPASQIDLGIQLLFAEDGAGDAVAGAGWIQKAAARGHADAQYLLSILLEAGKGLPKDPIKAAALLRSAAERGSAGAQEALGEHFYFGEGMPRDDRQAQAWFTQAANQGLALAQYNLGAMHLKERGGVEGWEAFKVAMGWFQKAARQGQVDAQYSLGFMHASGVGTEPDLNEAEFWYTQAAEQGDAPSRKALQDIVRLRNR
ncbi:tetratricopeptide repeat protein [Geothrix sp. PMB-07]|uniref:tetratricopeptide repeat protein n=1 Tax=Geothrix sp. PMB-07 TaxID=3068640 RepID=UPI0027407A45|nr:tetratricopeptide repeat protein [Geothrix sp. PMB-07]WLT33060.1 tetratricopeptide repeat protein [Geothrix sp. PMB-07]